MHPADLSDERERRTLKAYEAVGCDIHHAHVHATDDEAIDLQKLTRLCRARAITPQEARDHVIRLRRIQAARAQQAA